MNCTETLIIYHLREVSLLLMIIIAGLLGGIARNLFENKKPLEPLNIVLGLVATLITPLFLKTISSDLLKTYLNYGVDFVSNEAFLIFSIMILSSFFAQNFIQSVRDKVLRDDIKNLEDKVDENSDQFLKKSYLDLNENSKQLLKNIILTKKNSSFTKEELDEVSSLVGEEFNLSYQELLETGILKKNQNKYQISQFSEISELDKVFGPNY